MATRQEQIDALNSVAEGDMLEIGNLFPGLDPDEKVSWQVIEKCDDPKRAGRVRMTFRLYVFGVYWRAMAASVGADDVEWLQI